ncbi:hypothetical protein NQZ68_037842 [Dissostichus eleginoides]|nr:hypothetical protein NQZ68_037842 [Dissostichus eleginoides]
MEAGLRCEQVGVGGPSPLFPVSAGVYQHTQGSNQELAADKRPFTQVRSREMGATSGDAKPSPEGPTQSSPIRETPQSCLLQGSPGDD